MEVYPTESMSEKKFFSNVAPSLGSGPPLIYKAKYKGLISKNQYPAITFDWSVLRTWGQRLWTTFLMLFSGIPHLAILFACGLRGRLKWEADCKTFSANPSTRKKKPPT